MSSILELMKRNAVPAAVMRTASKGALPIPAEQMLEVLVYLTGNPLFAARGARNKSAGASGISRRAASRDLPARG